MILVVSDVVVSTKDQVSQEVNYMCKSVRLQVWLHPFLSLQYTKHLINVALKSVFHVN